MPGNPKRQLIVAVVQQLYHYHSIFAIYVACEKHEKLAFTVLQKSHNKQSDGETLQSTTTSKTMTGDYQQQRLTTMGPDVRVKVVLMCTTHLNYVSNQYILKR